MIIRSISLHFQSGRRVQEEANRPSELDLTAFHDDLGKFEIVLIGRDKLQAVLHGRSSDPDVVGRDRRSLFAQIGEYGGVSFRRLLVYIPDSHPRRCEEFPEHRFVPCAVFSQQEAGTQFAEYDRGQGDLVRPLKRPRNILVAAQEGRECRRIKGYFAFFHSPSSIPR